MLHPYMCIYHNTLKHTSYELGCCTIVPWCWMEFCQKITTNIIYCLWRAYTYFCKMLWKRSMSLRARSSLSTTAIFSHTYMVRILVSACIRMIWTAHYFVILHRGKICDCKYAWFASSTWNGGPLWAHSCFPFESANGDILQLFHGSQGVEKQVRVFIHVASVYTCPWKLHYT